jgi:hypothetical protein
MAGGDRFREVREERQGIGEKTEAITFAAQGGTPSETVTPLTSLEPINIWERCAKSPQLFG